MKMKARPGTQLAGKCFRTFSGCQSELPRRPAGSEAHSAGSHDGTKIYPKFVPISSLSSTISQQVTLEDAWFGFDVRCVVRLRLGLCGLQHGLPDKLKLHKLKN